MKYKPFLSLFAAFTLLCPNIAAAQTDDAGNAQAESLKLRAEISSGVASNALLDDSRTSKLALAADTVITVSAEQEINSIYLVWDKPVSPYKLSLGVTKLTCGENGFIHEFIDPLDSFTEFRLTVPEGGGILCSIYAFGSGETPNWVQQWKTITQPVDILFTPTHGDDELLFFGGAIPYYAGELGLETAVAFFTNHWGEPYRPHEQLNALWTAGLRLYPIFGEYSDIKWLGEKYAKDNGMYDGMLEGEVELLRRLKPQVIVGHDVNGEYGHDTHMLNTHILCKALELSGSASNYPESADKYGVWDVPKVYLHLYETNPVYIEWSDITLKSFGGKTSFEVAQEAFKKYTSQNGYYKLTPSTPESAYNCRKFGLFRSLVGSDKACNDFMENIVSYAEQYAQTTTEATTTTPEPTTTTPAATTAEAFSSATEAAESESDSCHFSLRSAIVLILLIISVVSIIIIKKQKGTQQPK